MCASYCCPCCDFELRAGDLLKGRCAYCGRLLDADEALQFLNEDDNEPINYQENGDPDELPHYINGAVARR